MAEWVVISVGGSLIVPDEVDVRFLRELRALVLKHMAKGRRFLIICGGGKTCRRYQAAAREIVTVADEDLDWIGIHSTRLNAQLLRTIFWKEAHKKVLRDHKERIAPKERLLVAAGWKPGHSTDYDAVMFAKNLKIRKIVNLTNLDYVYDRDPKLYSGAKKIEDISWKDFRKLLPAKWKPGLNSPFDPIASHEAERMGIEVAIINGAHLGELDSYLEGKAFRGTRIHG